MEWLDQELAHLKEVAAQWADPQIAELWLALAQLRELAMEELRLSDSWDQFLETRGGLSAIEKILDLKVDLRTRIQQMEEERKRTR